jgi:hypothetical protein
MSTSKKIKFNLNGVEFQLQNKHLQTVHFNGVKLLNPIIRVNHVAAAALCKQYVKSKYPNVVVSVTSDSFSGGNSTTVYLSDTVGGEVDKSIVDDVRNFGKQFVYGKFNGMIDMYEHNDNTLFTDNGTEMDPSVKYLSVENRPKFCTVPDICRMIVEMTTTTNYVYGMVDIKKAIDIVKDYGATESNINKALKLVA